MATSASPPERKFLLSALCSSADRSSGAVFEGGRTPVRSDRPCVCPTASPRWRPQHRRRRGSFYFRHSVRRQIGAVVRCLKEVVLQYGRIVLVFVPQHLPDGDLSIAAGEEVFTFGTLFVGRSEQWCGV